MERVDTHRHYSLVPQGLNHRFVEQGNRGVGDGNPFPMPGSDTTVKPVPLRFRVPAGTRSMDDDKPGHPAPGNGSRDG
jgi:hypothetical protein